MFFHQEELKVRFLTILWTVFMANLMIVFSSDTEILKVFQQQISRKNEKKLTASPIELVQTAIEGHHPGYL